MRTTADGQTQSRSGPRGRQRGVVLPHKYIVILKNGSDVGSLDIHSRAAEHNRIAKEQLQLQQQLVNDGRLRVEEEAVPNQVDHEYDFVTWKGYAGQFSPQFLHELENHDDVDYIEEDTMMWAWGVPESEDNNVGDGTNKGGELYSEPSTPVPNEGSPSRVSDDMDAEAIINGRNVHLDYYSLKTPSWGLTRIAQHARDLQKDYTYASSAGSDVDVYVIDSGVFAEHGDFEGRARNLINFVGEEEATDMCGHGTHVSGIIAGKQFGVAKSARILAVKVLDSEGQGSTSQVLAGINHVTKHAANNPNTKKVINMSLGGQFSRPVNEAVRTAVSKFGLPFFVAAGNTGDDACQYSPAGVEEAFAVGGTDKHDNVGWYSCTGTCVDLFAPGSGIVSDWIRSKTSAHILDGTSMASPHVAGVAALFLGSGSIYHSAAELYSDIIQHSTHSIVTGFSIHDHTSNRNLLYNKLEDIQDSGTIRLVDELAAQFEKDHTNSARRPRGRHN
ncbi:hypothetical protein BGW38_005448 [Lunasporangiospora selenospora]|uniref:Subtilase family protein n=1 Tax=Lunasporangiospora selenospora TaxID=979761 RepID=A0A9P6KBE0_9FUNG|nr:hypothetical protein BGW38_005448 [Lunasporangiospora selenospora]